LKKERKKVSLRITFEKGNMKGFSGNLSRNITQYFSSLKIGLIKIPLEIMRVNLFD